MTSASEYQPSVGAGEWNKEVLDNGNVLLYRRVEIGGNTYKISVGYNERLADLIDHPDQPLDATLKKVIEESEQKIRELIDSLQREAEPIENVTMKTNLVKRTSEVSIQAFGKKRETVSFKDLKDRGVALQQAASGLIQQIAGRCLKESDEAEPFQIRFKEKKPVDLAPFKRQTAAQLSAILGRAQSLRVPIADQHGVKKWQKFELDGHTVEVREFEQGAYNGPLMEDFRRRQQLVYKAVWGYLNDNKENIRDIEKVSKQLVALDLVFDKAYKEIQLDYEQMRTGKQATDHFLEVNQRQVELIAQFARDAQFIVNGALSSGEFTIDDIDRLEREEVLRRGRPIIVNIFTIQGQKFFSMQTPETKDADGNRGLTIPSTIRDRVGLANYVSTSFGTIDDNDTVHVDHYAIRHSSYTPIAVQNPFLRQAYALRNVRQLMTDLASVAMENQEGGDSPDDPLVIPLRSMMLLTPLKGDERYRSRKKFVAGGWTGESETQQLRESVLALSTMRDRVVPMNIKGKTVYVKLDSSFMNLGANKEAARVGPAGKIPISSIEGQINYRGYFEFLRDVEKHLLMRDMPGDCSKWLRSIILEERRTTGYKSKQKELAEMIDGSRADLNAKKAKLESLYLQYEESGDRQIAKEIANVRAEVLQIEKRINLQYKELYELRMKAINRNQQRIQVYQAEILNKLNDEIERAEDPEKKKELQLVRDVFENYLQAKAIFESKAYRNADTVMDFQTLYLQTYEMIGMLTELFCKSAEDRTGRVDNRVQERHAFRALLGRQAARNERDDQIIDGVIAPAVHQYSASRRANDENAPGSRGLQITPHVNQALPADIDRALATTAKGVPKKAKELSPRGDYPSDDRSIAA